MWASRMGPDGRILPALKTNQIAGFVKNTARSRIEKKNNALTIALFYYVIAKTTIHPSVGGYRWIFTSPLLHGPVNIHF